MLHELTLVRSSLEDAFMTLTADSVEYPPRPTWPPPKEYDPASAPQSPPTPLPRRSGPGGPGFGAVLRAEWIKF